jgi:hypothetical protein
MKKIICLFIAISLFFQTCGLEEDMLFDASPAERIAERMRQYNQILNDAPHGWKMEYWSGDMGGYVYLLKFETLENQTLGSVSIASELELSGYPIGTVAKSDYELKSDQSIVLTFNTYNPLFHFFAQPGGASGVRDGFKADYEFLVLSASPQEIQMQGKKRGDRIVMTRLEQANWQEYLENVIAKLQEHTNYVHFEVFHNDESVCRMEFNRNTRMLTFIEHNADGVEISRKRERFMYSTTEPKLSLYNQMTLHDLKFSTLTWNASAEMFTADYDGVMIKRYTPSFVQDVVAEFGGDYTFRYQPSNTSAFIEVDVTLSWHDGDLFKIEGIWTHRPQRVLILRYVREKLVMESTIIDYVGVNNNIPVFLAAYNGETSLCPHYIPSVPFFEATRSVSNPDLVEWRATNLNPCGLTSRGWIFWTPAGQYGADVQAISGDTQNNTRLVNMQMLKK